MSYQRYLLASFRNRVLQLAHCGQVLACQASTRHLVPQVVHGFTGSVPVPLFLATLVAALRNSHRTELLYVHNSHPLAPAISELAEKAASLSDKERAELPGEAIDPGLSDGVSGFLLPVAGDTCPAVISGVFGLGDDIISNAVLCVVYKLPTHIQHVCKLMEGTVLPEPSIKVEDLPPEKTLWHEDRGEGRRQGAAGAVITGAGAAMAVARVVITTTATDMVMGTVVAGVGVALVVGKGVWPGLAGGPGDLSGYPAAARWVWHGPWGVPGPTWLCCCSWWRSRSDPWQRVITHHLPHTAGPGGAPAAPGAHIGSSSSSHRICSIHQHSSQSSGL